jgi:hypothetical protein
MPDSSVLLTRGLGGASGDDGGAVDESQANTAVATAVMTSDLAHIAARDTWCAAGFCLRCDAARDVLAVSSASLDIGMIALLAGWCHGLPVLPVLPVLRRFLQPASVALASDVQARYNTVQSACLQ